MTRFLQICALVALAIIVACDGRDNRPTSTLNVIAPAPPPPPPPAPAGPTRPVRISGMATDDDGAPVADATIEVTVDDGPTIEQKLYATTNLTGFYELTADVLATGFPSFGFIKADSPGRERYFAYLFRNQTVTQDVRLYRITRIAAGESTRVTIRPGDSTCGHGDELTCRIVRVSIPTAGRLAMACEPTGDDNGGPGLTIVDYNDRRATGQPWFVGPGEVLVEVGMWFTSTISQSCILVTVLSGG